MTHQDRGLRLPAPGDGVSLEELDALTGACKCELVGRLSQEGGQVVGFHREHLRTCDRCQTEYPDLVKALRRFDEEFFDTLAGLLKAFDATLDLSDECIGRWAFPWSREGYDDEEQWELDREVSIGLARPHFAWRALRLGAYIGERISRYERTHGRGPGLWRQWRTGTAGDFVSGRVRDMDENSYLLASTARNMYFVLDWPVQDGPVRLPTDGDLTGLGGVLDVEDVEEIEKWEKVLGPPPAQVNVVALTYCALMAAESQARGDSPLAEGGGLSQEWRELRNVLLTLATEQREIVQGIEDRQNALIVEAERIRQSITATDRRSCEQSLLELMGETWGRLGSKAREHLLAAEQVYRTTDFAAPGVIVVEIACALEQQVKQEILPALYGHLKKRGPAVLRSPEGRDFVVFQRNWSPVNSTLGQMEQLLLHPEPAIAEWFARAGLDKDRIAEAIAAVRPLRNGPGHGMLMSFEEAKEVRDRWLTWKGLSGGVFAAIGACPGPPSGRA